MRDGAADLTAERQRDRTTRQILGVETIRDWTGVTDVALDQQRVGTGTCQRLLDVGAEVVVPDLLAIGVDQTPVGVAIAQALLVEIEQVSGIGVEPIDVCRIPRITAVPGVITAADPRSDNRKL